MITIIEWLAPSINMLGRKTLKEKWGKCYNSEPIKKGTSST